MHTKLLIALIYGGASSERGISIKTGQMVSKAIDRSIYKVIELDGATKSERSGVQIDDGFKNQTFDEYFENKSNPKPDLAFPALHGKYGEDGGIQTYLDNLGIKYTFSKADSSKLAMDKFESKLMFKKAGLLIAEDVLLKDKVNEQDLVKITDLGFPVVVKPSKQGSSFGITIVKNVQELKKAIFNAFEFDDEVLVEKYIKGREITVAVLGNKNDLEALPPVEIIPTESEFFDFHAKYNESACKEICPAEISDKLTAEAKRIGLIAHKALNCSGVSRTDIIIEEGADKMYVLETNTIPGMTPASLLPKAAKAAGYSFNELIQKIIDLGLENAL